MRKFMKVCAIVALIMIVLGIMLGIVGSSVAGRTTISQIVDNVTGGRVSVNFGDNGWGIFKKVEVGDMKLNLGNIFKGLGVNYSVEDMSMFNKNHEILSGDVEKYCPGSGIVKLEIEIGGCNFETKTSADDSVYLEAKDVRKFQGYMEGNTLYVKATMGSGITGINKDSKVIMYIPSNYSFDKVEIDMGAGAMEFDDLKAEEISLTVGAGQMVLDHVAARKLEASMGAGQIELRAMSVEELKAEVGMGEFLAEGAINGDVEVECSMGNVEMNISGSPEDFNYQLEGAMGSITLDQKSYGGLAREMDIDNGADKDMEIQCAMGNITIKFTN